MVHISVLKNEVLEYLDVGANKNFVDCTIGGGGHGLAILEKIRPKGRLLGIDRDEEMIRRLNVKCQMSNVKDRLILVNDSYTNLEKIVKEKEFRPIHGILFDLGLSSWHLEESGRGFSFSKDEPLDMRYHYKNQKSKIKNQKFLTAKEIINKWPEKEITQVLRTYGEERFSRRIAEEILKERQTKSIETTFQLVEIIKRAVPKNYERGRIHPATRTFQALRIAVNNELRNFQEALPQALNILVPKGRLVVISFHSLEDRIVKYFLSASAKGYGGQASKVKVLTRKPIRPSVKEVKENPRSRSAKLRAAQKL